MKMAIGVIAIVLAVTASFAEDATPPTAVGAWDLTADLKKIDDQWAPILNVLTDDTYFAIANADVSAWTCGQQAGHLAIVNKFVAENILQNLAEPSRNADGAQVDFVQGVLKQGFIPRGVGKAPTEYKPEKETREELLATLREAQSLWAQVTERAADLPACKARFAHFAFGQLTSIEWVRLAAVHNAHHLRIIRDILKASGNTEHGQELMPKLPPPFN